LLNCFRLTLDLQAFGGPDFVVQGSRNTGTMKTDAAAVYAQDTYNLTHVLRVTLGGRYSWERKAVDDQTEFDLIRPYSPSNPMLTPIHIDHKIFQAFTPKVGVEADVAPSTMRSSGLVAGSLFGSPAIGFLQPPRTYGVTLGYHF
jgi:iron complex outermembrane receptor protein